MLNNNSNRDNQAGPGRLTINPAGRHAGFSETKLHKSHTGLRFIILCFTVLFLSITLSGGVSEASNAKEKYFQADSAYKKLRNNKEKKKYRHNWLKCIDNYKSVYTSDPKGAWAPAGLFMSGYLSEKLYAYSALETDKERALDTYLKVMSIYPKSKYRLRASDAIRDLAPGLLKKRYQKDFRKPVWEARDPYKNTKPKEASKQKAVAKKQSSVVKPDKTTGTSKGKASIVKGLRHWSDKEYTRIVIDATKSTTYSHNLLKKDPSLNKPPRLYIDLKNTKLDSNLDRIVPINDDLLKNARAGQYTKDDVRIVVDIKSFSDYKVFPLNNPFRIVVDVWGDSAGHKPVYAKKTNRDKITEKGKTLPPGALARQLALGVRRIVIDPGHGGKDGGALGYDRKTKEKDVALQISKRLANRISKKLGCEVILTRSKDKYIPLEERTALANTKGADLFISIHTNAARNKRATGIETYFLNLATDDAAISVAARENATSEKNISDLQAILNDLMQNAKINESSRLANYVQDSLYKNMKKKYKGIKNKGVKQAPFYVLMGARMPAILVETAFISNSTECKRLRSSKYQDELCDAIIRGVEKYMKETNPSTLTRLGSGKGSDRS